MLSQLKKGDVLLIGCIVLIACVFATVNTSGGDVDSVVITVDGVVWREVPLHTNVWLEYDADGRHNAVVIDNGSVRMVAANCPDELCVKQGAISSPHSVIVCMPNRIAVRLLKTASDDDGVDVIARK